MYPLAPVDMDTIHPLINIIHFLCRQLTQLVGLEYSTYRTGRTDNFVCDPDSELNVAFHMLCDYAHRILKTMHSTYA